MGVIAITWGLGAIGVLLVSIGLIGRKVVPTTRCRRCRFDLSGAVTLDGPCPECGSSLGVPRGRYVHRRARSVGTLMCGVVLLTVSLAPTLIQMLPAYTSPAVMARKPVWLLLTDVDSARWQEAALDEYSRRRAANLLSNDDLRDVAVKGAMLPSAQRSSKWSDLIEIALEIQDLLPQHAITAYGLDAYRPQLKYPAKAWKGDKIVIRRSISHSRPNSAAQPGVAHVNIRWDETSEGFDITTLPVANGGNLVDIPADAADPIKVPVEIVMELRSPSGAVHRWKDSSSITIETVPNGTALVEIVEPGAPGVLEDIRLPCITLSGNTTMFYFDMQFEVHVLSVPVIATGEFLHLKPVSARNGIAQPLFQVNLEARKRVTRTAPKFQTISRQIALNDFPEILSQERMGFRLVPDTETARRLGVWRILGPIEFDQVDYVDQFADMMWPPRDLKRRKQR